ncbi:hypothetical protein ACFFGH_10090 [Lysobacter korlensis]|uniref:Uncharacterized protein n=1 Tax=Lysobacter korlensis TaxID=553636 RepID=A0ABV6RNP7_9GAMM
MDHDLKPGRAARIALGCGIAAIVVGLGLVLATVHPAIPLIAGGTILFGVGVFTWRRRS